MYDFSLSNLKSETDLCLIHHMIIPTQSENASTADSRGRVSMVNFEEATQPNDVGRDKAESGR
jgi:hypothetical protein